jgi:hypothetical protein
MTLATKEYRQALVAALADLTVDIDDMAAEWGPGALAPTILACEVIAKRARRLVALLNFRYGRERATTLYAAPDGKRYVYRTPRERELIDPEGLKTELAKLNMDGYQRALFERAFKREPATYKADQGVLNQMADRNKEARELIRSYRGWIYRPGELTLLDEAGEKQDGE